MSGTLYGIGVGPGDPELLTLKAARALAEADLVVHFAKTGSVGYALIYPIAVPAICFVLSLFLMPETRKMSIWAPEAAKA